MSQGDTQLLTFAAFMELIKCINLFVCSYLWGIITFCGIDGANLAWTPDWFDYATPSKAANTQAAAQVLPCDPEHPTSLIICGA